MQVWVDPIGFIAISVGVATGCHSDGQLVTSLMYSIFIIKIYHFPFFPPFNSLLDQKTYWVKPRVTFLFKPCWSNWSTLVANSDLHCGAALQAVLHCRWCCIACGAALQAVLQCRWCCIAGGTGSALQVVLHCRWCDVADNELFWKSILNSLVKLRNILQKKVLNRGLEVGEKNPFPVWTIKFPVLKTNFELLAKIDKHFEEKQSKIP